MGNVINLHTKTKQKDITAAEHDLQALELRKGGATLQQIATAMQISNTGTVSRMISRCLKRTAQEPADQLRAMELLRYDAILLALWPRATGKTPDLGAIDRILKVMQQRATLLGLNAPIRVNWRMMVDNTATSLGLSADEKKKLHERVALHLTESRSEYGHH